VCRKRKVYMTGICYKRKETWNVPKEIEMKGIYKNKNNKLKRCFWDWRHWNNFKIKSERMR